MYNQLLNVFFHTKYNLLSDGLKDSLINRIVAFGTPSVLEAWSNAQILAMNSGENLRDWFDICLKGELS